MLNSKRINIMEQNLSACVIANDRFQLKKTRAKNTRRSNHLVQPSMSSIGEILEIWYILVWFDFLKNRNH